MGGDCLFVYGTLLAVAEHPMGDLLRANGRFVGHGSIQARLYMIDDPDDPGQNYYPGAVPSGNPNDQVYGEVFVVDNPLIVFPAFDAFEACSTDWPEPHEFMLRSVKVQMDQGDTRWARSYIYTWDTTNAHHIPSGRYRERSPGVR